MLERPALSDEKIIACLRDEYGLKVGKIVFLPLGADMNTAVFRAELDDTDSTPYFVKLRSGHFDEIAVDVPKFLFDQGISQIIAPMPRRSGQLSAHLEAFNLILYPFVEGQSGWDKNLSDQDWVVFGRTLKAIHTVTLPSALARIPQESYSAYWRDMVRQFQTQVEAETFADPVGADLAKLLKAKQSEINHLIKRAEDLGAVLRDQPSKFVLCHSDIHVGNILMSSSSDELYIVDWDQPLLAPKERDLMFIGAGIDGRGEYAEHDEHLFYEGYGQTAVDPVALAYYRYERIVQDIAAYCQQLLLTDEGGEDRPEGLRQLTSQFQPGAAIDMAYRTEKRLPAELQSGQ
jgi:spectinomycin phosphotransferase